MPEMLALGLGTACIVAAVLLFVSGYLAGAAIVARSPASASTSCSSRRCATSGA